MQNKFEDNIEDEKIENDAENTTKIEEAKVVEEASNETSEKVESEVKEQAEEIKEEKVEKKKKSINWTGVMFNILAVICISIFAISIAPKELQNDTFYTIRLGEEIYNNGLGNLTQDNYSWIDLPYTYPHWLYDLSIFLIYNSFGHLGIYISTMILTALLGISIYALCNKKSKNRVVSFVLTLCALWLVKPFVAARAQLVTFILFVIAVYVIEKLLETNKLRYAIPLFIIPLLISNLHSAVYLFYFVLLLPYIASEFLSSIAELNLDLLFVKLFNKIKRLLTRKEEKKELITEKINKINEAMKKRDAKRVELRKAPYKVRVTRYKGTITLLLLLIPLFFIGTLNPVNNDSYTYLVKTLHGNTTLNINEHKPMVVAENINYMVAVAAFISILVFTDTKINFADIFMLGGLTYLSMKSIRQESMFAIICMPILAGLIGEFINKYDKQTFQKLEEFFSKGFGGTILICCFIIFGTHLIKDNIHDEYISSSDYPVAATKWIKENLDYKNIKLFNEYNYGSYLLLEGVPVFIDSRCDLYTPEFNGDPKNDIKGKDIFSDALDIAANAVNYNIKFDEYGVTHILIKDTTDLAKALINDDRYKKIGYENDFLIFERLEAVSEKTK